MITIYKITNLVNFKVYIGITTKSLEERFEGHVNHSKMPKFRLHHAIKKYGKDKFSIEQIDMASNQEEANKLEESWISKFKSTDYTFGYNMSSGGSGKSISLSEETKAKIKNSVKLHRDSLSLEEKKKMTKSANAAKRGMKESHRSRKIKSEAQSIRWKKSSNDERKKHGALSRNNMSEQGKIKSLSALKNSYSSAREPGLPKAKVECPHCNKIGGFPIMKRYHFDNCKENQN